VQDGRQIVAVGCGQNCPACVITGRSRGTYTPVLKDETNYYRRRRAARGQESAPGQRKTEKGRLGWRGKAAKPNFIARQCSLGDRPCMAPGQACWCLLVGRDAPPLK